MKYFELKDSFKNDDPGNYVFFLSFIAVRGSWENLFMLRKYPYEKYIDFYLSHKNLFLKCDADLKALIDNRLVNDKSYKGPSEISAKKVLDEFEKRCINYLDGTAQRWRMMLCSVLGFTFFLFLLGSISIQHYSFILLFSFLLVISMTELWVDLRCFLAITKRIKSNKRHLMWFPFNMELVYKLLEISLNNLSEREKVHSESEALSESGKLRLTELCDMGQLIPCPEQNDYLLQDTLISFMIFKETEYREDEIPKELVCSRIRQRHGERITSDGYDRAKSKALKKIKKKLS